jgi:ADP-glucose pyrophosphorylase
MARSLSIAHIDRAVIGIRSVIGSGTTIRNSVLMGADYYQAEAWEPKPGLPPLGIGCRCHIEGTIIDKNARIGEGVVVTPEGKPDDADGENYCISRWRCGCPKRHRNSGWNLDLKLANRGSAQR